MEKRKAPEKKVKIVKELAEAIKGSSALLLLSIKSLPSPQLQKAKKEIRGRADIKVVKKNILLRAIDETKMPGIEGLKQYIQSDCALALSKEDAFGLAGWLSENKSPVSAKEGQIAEEDIKVEAGPTELMPGPAISELGALGLKVSVEEGKIAIREGKVVVKKGDKVSAGAASVFQKLDIKPFMVGVNVMVIYDAKADKIYKDIKIDRKKALADLVLSQAKALGFAIGIAYPSKNTIGFLLAKANAHLNALNKLATKTQA